MKKRWISWLLAALVLTGCAAEKIDTSYEQINAEAAKAVMDQQPEAVVLDVREPHEFENGHIPGAVLLPLGTIAEDTAAAVIPESDTTVLIYCRSGNRSKQAASALYELGYTNLYEFGGINDWPYDVTD